MSTFVEQAGAVTFRPKSGSFEILLIKSKKTPRKWVFPKGHIEQGESAAEAAKRELLEEAGVTGTILGAISNVLFSYNEKDYRVAYFLTLFEASKADGEPGREPTWVNYSDAMNMITVPQMKEVLESAVPMIKKFTV
jgi:8-oxo-dGTP pyrophosphatase MutT (NUDIX family)